MPATWERQETDTVKSWHGFRIYRDMGLTRSLADVARELGVNKRVTEGWSARHQWVVRAAAWDAEQDRLWRAEILKMQRDAARRHVKIAQAMQSKLVTRLQAINPSELGVRDLAYWFDVTAKIERQAMGEPERVEVSGPSGAPMQVELLTDEERQARLNELRREIDRRVDQKAS